MLPTTTYTTPNQRTFTITGEYLGDATREEIFEMPEDDNTGSMYSSQSPNYNHCIITVSDEEGHETTFDFWNSMVGGSNLDDDTLLDAFLCACNDTLDVLYDQLDDVMDPDWNYKQGKWFVDMMTDFADNFSGNLDLSADEICDIINDIEGK